MNKIIDYCIRICIDEERLMKNVCEYIQCGWQPCGGVIIDSGRYLQAMIKYESPPAEEIKCCPFCGDECALITNTGSGSGYIECQNHECSVRPTSERFEHSEKADAIKKWNTRHD